MNAIDNTKENIAIINDEVRNKLVYNGIKQENGDSYYDYTTPAMRCWAYQSVPETVINYLLYELAFSAPDSSGDIITERLRRHALYAHGQHPHFARRQRRPQKSV